MLFYLMIKNHPFQNGNKRIAVTTLLYFLVRNRRWIKMNNDALYEFARAVAESDARQKETVLSGVERTLSRVIIFEHTTPV